jgi:hypothetical protein
MNNHPEHNRHACKQYPVSIGEDDILEGCQAGSAVSLGAAAQQMPRAPVISTIVFSITRVRAHKPPPYQAVHAGTVHMQGSCMPMDHACAGTMHAGSATACGRHLACAGSAVCTRRHAQSGCPTAAQGPAMRPPVQKPSEPSHCRTAHAAARNAPWPLCPAHVHPGVCLLFLIGATWNAWCL